VEICTWPAAGIGRWYTWLISAFVHNNLTHIIMNMVSFYAIGPAYERKVGSLALLLQSLLFAFYIGALQYGLSATVDPLLARLASGYQIPQLSNSCGVGFSGVLFALWGIRSYEPGAATTTETVFFIQTSSKMAPCLSLIVIQFLVPNASFFGHLLGLVLGILCALR
jgi:rhomboid domain-containing protein 1